MSASLQGDSDTGVVVPSEDRGTITGLTLQYQLGLLNDLVNENQVACESADGSYVFALGVGL